MNDNLNDTHSLSHTKWYCKYHVVFAPKFHWKAIYGKERQILDQYCGS